MSEVDLLFTGLRIAAPLIADNRQSILEKIKSGYRKISQNNTTMKASVYLTMFIDFKVDYPIESINQHVCHVLQKYKIGKDECQHKYNQTNFSIIRHFNYSDHFYAPDDFTQFDEISNRDNEIEINIPLVNGISFYLFPDDNSKNSLMDGHSLTEFLEKELLKKYDIKQSGMFVYIQSENVDELKSFLNSLNKKLNNSNGTCIRNLSKKDNELKIENNPLIAKILGEVL